eukprot:15618053-Heterocapsa_arctica.AAC.1
MLPHVDVDVEYFRSQIRISNLRPRGSCRATRCRRCHRRHTYTIASKHTCMSDGNTGGRPLLRYESIRISVE